VDIGDVPLFPGPTQRLTVLGAAATGLWFHSQEGHPTVYSVMPGSPSDLAGARIGEPVLAVDDTDVRGLSSSVVEGLVATGGRTVRLTVQSPTGPRVVSFVRPEPGTP
jgi:C-terminal processing protease CtpA/Prc